MQQAPALPAVTTLHRWLSAGMWPISGALPADPPETQRRIWLDHAISCQIYPAQSGIGEDGGSSLCRPVIGTPMVRQARALAPGTVLRHLNLAVIWLRSGGAGACRTTPFPARSILRNLELSGPPEPSALARRNGLSSVPPRRSRAGRWLQ